jgi:hypothetical protein
MATVSEEFFSETGLPVYLFSENYGKEEEPGPSATEPGSKTNLRIRLAKGCASS